MKLLHIWVTAVKEQGGKVPTRGVGNYLSDEAKEIARIMKELRDEQNALGV